jgi:hypothetical protein
MATPNVNGDPEKMLVGAESEKVPVGAEKDNSSEEVVKHSEDKERKSGSIKGHVFGSRRNSHSLAEQALTLDELPDVDEGKSEEERAKLDRALTWKVDIWLIPWLCLLYLLSFLDVSPALYRISENVLRTPSAPILATHVSLVWRMTSICLDATT